MMRWYSIILCGIFVMRQTYSTDNQGPDTSKKDWKEEYYKLSSRYAAIAANVTLFQIREQRTEYDRFICAASIIRRCGDILYKEVIEYLKRAFIRIHYYKQKDRKEHWFKSEFDNWRYETYKPINDSVPRAILRICPKNKILTGRMNQEEFIDYIERSESKYAVQLRDLLPTYEKRVFVAALIPCTYYKMCSYLHPKRSVALQLFQDGTVKSLFDALMNYNHWKLTARDIRYLNNVLSIVDNVQLRAEKITDDKIAFPVADLQTGC